MDMEDTEAEDWECLLSDHFGRTPLHTPFGSQTESCVIDLSDDEVMEENEIDFDKRVRQYLEECEHEDQIDEQPNYEPEDTDSDLEKVRTLKRDGCKCSLNCCTNFSEEDMYAHILNVREMTKNDRDMYIMGYLGECDNETKRGKKRLRNRRQFRFHGKQVCKATFMLVYSIGERGLKNLFKHIDINGKVARCHGNTGKRNASALSFEDIMCVVKFVTNYADIHGLPQPAAPHGRDNTPPVYLHCQTTKKSVHSDYTQSLSQSARSVKYTTFVKIWNNCLPHIRIASPKDDVCATCEKLRKKVLDARDEDEKLQSSSQMRDHIMAAQSERELYNDCIARAMNGNDDGTPYDHLTFDYCQNVSLPHHGRQMGPLYFTTPRKIQIVGVRIDGLPKQLNFLIDENETIGIDGTLTHGPNAVISMLDWVLENYRTGPACAFHADNCSGQNKNQYVLGYFMWRVLTGRHDTIEFMMQIPGHARCRVDGGFGHIKQLYRRSDCDSIQQLEDVVNRSCTSNEAVRFPTWQWRDWKTFLSGLFCPLKGIRRYQYFKFSSRTPGIVTVRTERNGVETTSMITRTRNPVIDADQLPVRLAPGGLSVERQKYLYRNVRPYVREMYQDITCPAPGN